MAQESFDLEAVYDAEVAPLMTKLIEVCEANNMPFFATFLYANNEDEGEDGVCTSFYMPEERPIPEMFLNLRNFRTPSSTFAVARHEQRRHRH